MLKNFWLFFLSRHGSRSSFCPIEKPCISILLDKVYDQWRKLAFFAQQIKFLTTSGTYYFPPCGKSFYPSVKADILHQMDEFPAQ